MGMRVPNNFELVLRSLLQQATWSGPLEIKMSRWLPLFILKQASVFCILGTAVVTVVALH